jgi:hypothetical protein
LAVPTAPVVGAALANDADFGSAMVVTISTGELSLVAGLLALDPNMPAGDAVEEDRRSEVIPATFEGTADVYIDFDGDAAAVVDLIQN